MTLVFETLLAATPYGLAQKIFDLPVQAPKVVAGPTVEFIEQLRR